VLIGFSNSIRGAKRFTASKALADSDNDISCHARNYGTGPDRVPIAVSKAGVLFTQNRRTTAAKKDEAGGTHAFSHAVELRESKSDPALLLLDTVRAGAGMLLD